MNGDTVNDLELDLDLMDLTLAHLKSNRAQHLYDKTFKKPFATQCGIASKYVILT